MVRTAKSKIAQKEKSDLLYRAILTLKNEEECYSFFQDLCTMKNEMVFGIKLAKKKRKTFWISFLLFSSLLFMLPLLSAKIGKSFCKRTPSAISCNCDRFAQPFGRFYRKDAMQATGDFPCVFFLAAPPASCEPMNGDRVFCLF